MSAKELEKMLSKSFNEARKRKPIMHIICGQAFIDEFNKMMDETLKAEIARKNSSGK